MAKGKKKLDSKAFAQQKRHRRQWITFVRMIRYGINNFTRNAWLTIAATAVMTVTLTIIFVSAVAQNVVADTGMQINDEVGISIYLKTTTEQEVIDDIIEEVEDLPTVVSVTVETPEQARESFIDQNKANNESLEATKEASLRYPWTINIRVIDINDTSVLQEYTETSELYKENADRNPSFAGESRVTIENIGRIVDFTRSVGVGASILFTLISSLIIFNTIRMAIFNRREEIQMMKLIGAEPSFIRGPFVVEAIVYGFIAAIIASAIGYGLVLATAPTLLGYEITMQPTIDFLIYYVGFVVLGVISVGAIIGIISSLLATRRYLKL